MDIDTIKLLNKQALEDAGSSACEIPNSGSGPGLVYKSSGTNFKINSAIFFVILFVIIYIITEKISPQFLKTKKNGVYVLDKIKHVLFSIFINIVVYFIVNKITN